MVLNDDQSVTLNGDDSGCTAELVTAVQPGNAAFVGSSFGGGAYITASLKWQPISSSSAKPLGWPAFWSMPLEGHMTPYSDQWPGQAQGYMDNIEADFFEALPDEAGTAAYGGSLHNWYGIYLVSCAPAQQCAPALPYSTGQRAVPAGTDFSQYHDYGFLWVPATASTNGYAKFYFDGVEVGYTFEWEQYRDQPPPPDNQPWAFGILDQRHLFLLLGTSQAQPMTVRSVDVWQASVADNIHH